MLCRCTTPTEVTGEVHGLQIRSVAANVLNEQVRAAEKGWVLKIGWRFNNVPPYSALCYLTLKRRRNRRGSLEQSEQFGITDKEKLFAPYRWCRGCYGLGSWIHLILILHLRRNVHLWSQWVIAGIGFKWFSGDKQSEICAVGVWCKRLYQDHAQWVFGVSDSIKIMRSGCLV